MTSSDPVSLHNPGQTGAGRAHHRLRAYGWQVDAAVLVRLHRLGQHANGCAVAGAKLGGKLGAAPQHGVGALLGLDR